MHFWNFGHAKGVLSHIFAELNKKRKGGCKGVKGYNLIGKALKSFRKVEHGSKHKGKKGTGKAADRKAKRDAKIAAGKGKKAAARKARKEKRDADRKARRAAKIAARKEKMEAARKAKKEKRDAEKKAKKDAEIAARKEKRDANRKIKQARSSTRKAARKAARKANKKDDKPKAE